MTHTSCSLIWILSLHYLSPSLLSLGPPAEISAPKSAKQRKKAVSLDEYNSTVRTLCKTNPPNPFKFRLLPEKLSVSFQFLNDKIYS